MKDSKSTTLLEKDTTTTMDPEDNLGIRLTIYTGGERTTFPPCDMSWDLQALGVRLLDHTRKTQNIQSWILRHIERRMFANCEQMVKDQEQNKPNWRVGIKCRHGLHRSVDTAEFLRARLSGQAEVEVVHLEFRNPFSESAEAPLVES